MDAEQKAALGGLIIVFDGALNHPKRLISAADELWGDKPKKLIEQFENSISLASVEIRSPLFWSKYTSMTLHEFRKIMR